MSVLPEPLADLRRRALERRLMAKAVRESAARQYHIAVLDEGQWYSFNMLVSMLGVHWEYLSRGLDKLTWKVDVKDGRRTRVIRADTRLEDFCREHYLNVKIGSRRPTLYDPDEYEKIIRGQASLNRHRR